MELDKLISEPSEQYHKNPGLSSTSVKAMSISLKKYQERKRFVPTSPMRIGTGVHGLLLEPEDFEWETVESRLIEEYQKENQSTFFCTKREAETFQRIAERAWKHPLVKKILSFSDTEKSYYWRDDDGLLKKCRFDFISKREAPEHFWGDLKITENPFPGLFDHIVRQLRYMIQYAWYDEAAQRIFPGLESRFLIAISNVDPFPIVLYRVPEQKIAWGRKDADAAVKAILAFEKAIKGEDSLEILEL